MIALDSETKHRRQKEPAQISKHIACPHTEACLFKPSLCACSQLLALTPNFLMLGGSTWTLLLTLCSPSRKGSCYQSEQVLHFCVSSTALTPVLKWKSNTGLICQCGVFVQEHTPLIESTNSPGLSMTLNDSPILFIWFLYFSRSVVCLFFSILIILISRHPDVLVSLSI